MYDVFLAFDAGRTNPICLQLERRGIEGMIQDGGIEGYVQVAQAPAHQNNRDISIAQQHHEAGDSDADVNNDGDHRE